MRVSWFVACAVLFAVGLWAGTQVAAQRPASPSGGRPPVALVDLNTMMQKSSRLKQSMDALKSEYMAKAEALKKEGERGNQMTEAARKLPTGSPERKDAEQKVLKARADFELKGKKVNDETREKELKVVTSMLRELKDELSRYGQASGVPLILRYDTSPPDLDNGRAILAEIQKPIVYQRASDVTPAILEAMNRRTGPAASTATRPAAPAAGRAVPR